MIEDCHAIAEAIGTFVHDIATEPRYRFVEADLLAHREWVIRAPPRSLTNLRSPPTTTLQDWPAQS
jgi:hypothetical protein